MRYVLEVPLGRPLRIRHVSMRHAGSAGATVTELFPHDVLNESFSHAIWTQLSSRALPNRPPACPSPHVRCRGDGSINAVRSSRSLAHSSLTESADASRVVRDLYFKWEPEAEAVVGHDRLTLPSATSIPRLLREGLCVLLFVLLPGRDDD